jgi:hypothetical protein
MSLQSIRRVELPERVRVGEGFVVRMQTEGEPRFAQLIVRHADGHEWIVRDHLVEQEGPGQYRFDVPPEAYHAGIAYLQVEGCRKATVEEAGPEDWETVYCEVEIDPVEAEPEPAMIGAESDAEADEAREEAETGRAETRAEEAAQAGRTAESPPARPREAETSIVDKTPTREEPVLYFAIHKHMHQPYYDATDPDFWSQNLEQIFGERTGAYTHFLPAAVRQYIEGGLPHGGLTTSWSGSLIEQLDRAAAEGRCGGAFAGWKDGLRALAGETTMPGNPRLGFSAFGHFHPLMPLIPHRDTVGQIRMHAEAIREAFGVSPTEVLFPPETAFHPHMIPALKEAGIRAVIYDTIHHYRATKGYPYPGPEEGLLPPNPADQENFDPGDWTRINNVWAPSPISPKLLRPWMLVYTDADGERHEILGVPAERFLGNEDARGGYGALQYEDAMGQILDAMVGRGDYDPAHPPFFVLHSDGDNHGGGAESYYTSNTARLVEMCRTNPRFQLTTIEDYLERFPVDAADVVHLEPGSWAGADNGDPQFAKWFGRSEADYSPDLNSWAVLTAFQNVVHSLEDAGQDKALVADLKQLLYTAEASDYWYWTGQEEWDTQVTAAVNTGMAAAEQALKALLDFAGDITGPTIFPPWVRPANPGGKAWGQGGLVDAEAEATFRTFVHDVSGVKAVTLAWRPVGGAVQEVQMERLGPYESQTDPAVIATQYKAVLPAGSGDIRYYVEAADARGNTTRSPVGRIYIA